MVLFIEKHFKAPDTFIQLTDDIFCFGEINLLSDIMISLSLGT